MAVIILHANTRELWWRHRQTERARIHAWWCVCVCGGGLRSVASMFTHPRHSRHPPFMPPRTTPPPPHGRLHAQPPLPTYHSCEGEPAQEEVRRSLVFPDLLQRPRPGPISIGLSRAAACAADDAARFGLLSAALRGALARRGAPHQGLAGGVLCAGHCPAPRRSCAGRSSGSRSEEHFLHS